MYSKLTEANEALTKMDNASKAIHRGNEITERMGRFLTAGLHAGISGKAADALAAMTTSNKSAGAIQAGKLMDLALRMGVTGELYAKHIEIAKILTSPAKMGSLFLNN
jgi:hypothetical protein